MGVHQSAVPSPDISSVRGIRTSKQATARPLPRQLKLPFESPMRRDAIFLMSG